MQPASQVDTLIWRCVLRSSMSSEYIKPINPSKTYCTIQKELYVFYSFLSLIFTSHSMKTCYTYQAAVHAATAPRTAPYKVLQVAGTSSKALWKWLVLQLSEISRVSLTAYTGGVFQALQHKRDQHPILSFKPVTGLIGLLAVFSELKMQLDVEWPWVQICLCIFGGFIIVTVSLICPRALSGGILATF